MLFFAEKGCPFGNLCMINVLTSSFFFKNFRWMWRSVRNDKNPKTLIIYPDPFMGTLYGNSLFLPAVTSLPLLSSLLIDIAGVTCFLERVSNSARRLALSPPTPIYTYLSYFLAYTQTHNYIGRSPANRVSLSKETWAALNR